MARWTRVKSTYRCQLWTGSTAFGASRQDACARRESRTRMNFAISQLKVPVGSITPNFCRLQIKDRVSKSPENSTRNFARLLLWREPCGGYNFWSTRGGYRQSE